MERLSQAAGMRRALLQALRRRPMFAPKTEAG
jgi:hypothetical protein